jgi:cellobiose phosphorylase
VARHRDAVQRLETQHQETKAELEAAHLKYLTEKEIFLSEGNVARQRQAKELNDLIEEKEKLQRQLAELRASR